MRWTGRLTRRRAERLLDGRDSDAGALGRVLDAAAAPAQGDELAREDATVAMFHAARLDPVAATRREPVRSSTLGRLAAVKAVIATVAAVLLMSSGIALAASHQLPWQKPDTRPPPAATTPRTVPPTRPTARPTRPTARPTRPTGRPTHRSRATRARTTPPPTRPTYPGLPGSVPRLRVRQQGRARPRAGEPGLPGAHRRRRWRGERRGLLRQPAGRATSRPSRPPDAPATRLTPRTRLTRRSPLTRATRRSRIGPTRPSRIRRTRRSRIRRTRRSRTPRTRRSRTRRTRPSRTPRSPPPPEGRGVSGSESVVWTGVTPAGGAALRRCEHAAVDPATDSAVDDLGVAWAPRRASRLGSRAEGSDRAHSRSRAARTPRCRGRDGRCCAVHVVGCGVPQPHLTCTQRSVVDRSTRRRLRALGDSPLREAPPHPCLS